MPLAATSRPLQRMRAELGKRYRRYSYLWRGALPRPRMPFDCVFVVGHFKTGTTSTAAFLESLGSRHLTKNERVNEFRKRGDLRYLDKLSRRFNSFDDLPWNRLDVIEHFMAQDRNFRFILTDRDPDEWFDSLSRFVMKIGQKPICPSRRVEFIEERFQYHNATVGRLAAQSDHPLLRLDVTSDADAAEKIVDFLDLVPERLPVFPHLNRTR